MEQDYRWREQYELQSQESQAIQTQCNSIDHIYHIYSRPHPFRTTRPPGKRTVRIPCSTISADGKPHGYHISRDYYPFVTAPDTTIDLYEKLRDWTDRGSYSDEEEDESDDKEEGNREQKEEEGKVEESKPKPQEEEGLKDEKKQLR